MFKLSDKEGETGSTVSLIPLVDNLWKTLLNFLIPLNCSGCGRRNFWLCADCLSKLCVVEAFTCAVCGQHAIKGLTHPSCYNSQSLDRLISVYQYKSPLRETLHCIKYRRQTGLVNVLVDLVYDELDSWGISFGAEAVFVPVPLHWKKYWRRWFNQADLLAEGFARHYHLSVRADLLQRKRDTPSQTKLSRKERHKNVYDVFETRLSKVGHIAGRDFIIVDDICTTGATLNACAAALKKAGARYVWGLTVAKD